MRHDLSITGISYKLRPVEHFDAPFIVELRSNPILNRYIHSTSSSIDDQHSWLESYFERQGDYYFIVEAVNSGSPEGVISLYDIDEKLRCGEWGRWILKPGSLAPIESAWLIYRCAFELLGLKEIYCRTVANNRAVVSFHDSCGIKNRKLLSKFFTLNGQKLDAIEHRVEIENWSGLSNRLSTLAKMITNHRNRQLNEVSLGTTDPA